jgi:hypothetical protein
MVARGEGETANQRMKMERREHRLAVVDGVTMRSTLEARWAVFFGCLRLKWQYEPRTFDLNTAGRYTPDFRVDNLGWVEIKPTVDHLRESWSRIKGFLATKPEPIYAFCSDKVRLRKNEMVCFKDGAILIPNEAQMYEILSTARDKNLGIETDLIYNAGIAAAIETANASKMDHMVSVQDHFRYDADRIILNDLQRFT